MRVTKDNKVKLEAGEVRAGNFFFKVEKEHIKITDLGKLMSYRVQRKMAIGIWLENTIEMGKDAEETLRTYAAAVWTFLCLVPDQEAVSGIVRLTEEAMKRHPDWYGYKPVDDDKADAEAVQEMQELHEFEESVKNMPETEKTDV